MKIFLPIIVSVFLFLISPSVIHAKVWINEFSSHGSDDWIELYNDAEESVSLDGLRFRDNTNNNKFDLTGQIGPKGFIAFQWGDKLNNGGDIIRLVSISEENISLDQVTYDISADVAIPDVGQTGGRKDNGGPQWVIFANASKGISNFDSQLAPTLTPLPPPKTPTPKKDPTPTKTPTPKKEPTPTKSTSTSAATNNIDDSAVAGVSVSKSTGEKVFKISGVPTAILGTSTVSAYPTNSSAIAPKQKKEVMVKDATSSPIWLIAVGTLFCVACGILVVLKRRSMKHE